MRDALAQVATTVAGLKQHQAGDLQQIGAGLERALAGTEEATEQVLEALAADPAVALGGSFDYLMQCGYLFGGWQLARSALLSSDRLAAGEDNDFYRRKIATARFYAEQILPRCAAHGGAIATAAGALNSYPVDWL